VDKTLKKKGKEKEKEKVVEKEKEKGKEKGKEKRGFSSKKGTPRRLKALNIAPSSSRSSSDSDSAGSCKNTDDENCFNESESIFSYFLCRPSEKFVGSSAVGESSSISSVSVANKIGEDHRLFIEHISERKTIIVLYL
jgi:hypothetical protein